MHHNGGEAADHTLRFLKNPELPQERGAIIVGPLCSQPVLFVTIQLSNVKNGKPSCDCGSANFLSRKEIKR
jgi:hypothetical protein